VRCTLPVAVSSTFGVFSFERSSIFVLIADVEQVCPDNVPRSLATDRIGQRRRRSPTWNIVP
jgi:hypothetical protein